jgi:DNA polymerase II large subunit
MSKNMPMSAEYQRYFSELKEKLDRLYDIARQARGRGLDPELFPEPEITNDIPERVEKLIGPPGIGARIKELESMDRREMAFKVAEEIVYGRFGKLDATKAADQAIRTALAILTEGVTIAPIEGIPEIKIKQNADRSRYLAVYFAGPIRPAGGTAQALTLVAADFVRRCLGLDRYRPSDAVVKRFVEEVRLYERQVRRFQYHVSDEDLAFAVSNLPVEATGVGTDPYEVSSFRDVPGIETNRIRGGALIVVVDGVVGRARKLLGICESCHLDGWEWLSKLGNASMEAGESTASFMEEIIVGRPVFSFPNRAGGFRLRYGRARNTGLAAVGVHPASMIIMNKFLTTGVQLRIELPGKSAAVAPVDSIEPPVVKLKDGSVVRVESPADAERLLGSVAAILFIGDVLINAGDFIQNNKSLLPAGYDENQWRQDLSKAAALDHESFTKTGSLTSDRLGGLISDASTVPTPHEALIMSESGVPLHPRFTYLWSRVTIDALVRLRENLSSVWPRSAPYEVKIDEDDKSTLEELLVPHRVSERGIILEEAAPILEKCLALDRTSIDSDATTPLELVRIMSGMDVREKAPVYVGARMGRPEKAKERKMSPYVHGLFPIENAGGAQRDILKTERGHAVQVEVIDRRCPKCGALAFGVKCPSCGADNVTVWRCPRCGRTLDSETCPACNVDATAYRVVDIDVREMLERARKHVNVQLPERFKGVKRLMNEKRLPESLEKGLLRARHDLSVFKDGTIRFDMTDVPLTHFRPSEVGASVETMRSMGYTADEDGLPLESPDQMVELRIQDVVLPEGCGDYMVKVSAFIDELLSRFYGLGAFYSVRNRNELIGHLVLGLAPHTSAAVVGRVIGYTKNRVCYAHPLWHASKRRNCDGDEDAVMLALDPLLNFSKEFLPEQIGGMMDAPLFVIPVINPSEVDKEAHNFDVMPLYPPEFYRLCEESAVPNVYGSLIDTIGGRLGTESQFQGARYTERCSDINMGAHEGAYTSLQTMLEKLDSQLDLSEKLKAVDVKAVALRILNTHFMKDIVGNLNAFTNQEFRCVKCNQKYRRPPLRGKCTRCGGPLTMTVYRGGIKKYIEPAMKLVKKYDLGDYYADRLTLVKEEMDSLFVEEPQEEPTKKHVDLTDFLRG